MLKLFLYIICLTVTVSGSVYAETNFVKRPDVQEFIDYMVKKNKFKKAELVSVFNEVKIRPKVIQKVKTPLEHKPWYLYQRLFVTEWRIREGLNFWNKHKEALDKAEKIYGVPASLIVATVGIETKYGKNTGDYPVIDALTNLAFDSPRAKYFRYELENFLLMTREHKLNPLKVLGSYAGAIGQPQFMPSSFRNYAVNFSNSGKIDLSNNETDVIGSIANYYKKHGWKTGEAVAIPASKHGGQFQLKFNGRRSITQSELIQAGVAPVDIQKVKYKIIPLQSSYGHEYWLGFHNFSVIKRYNSSDLYAMAVYQLSFYINALRERNVYAASS